MSEWKSIRIEEIAAPTKNALATGPFGSAISSRHFRDEGVPVIRGSNLSLDVGIRLDERDLVYLDESKAAEFSRSVAVRGDLVFTCWGTIGQVGLIDERASFDRYVVSNKQMKLSPDRRVVDPLFLYYALSAPSSVSQMVDTAIGSSVPGFNLGQLRKLKLSLPPLSKQRVIAAVLGVLDDKIALNDRAVKTCDELSSALFRRMLDRGSIRDVKLEEVADVNRKSVKPSLGSDLRYLDISSVSLGNVNWPGRISWEDAPGRARRKAFKGDILWSTVRPGRRSYALILENDPDLVVSTGFAVITPRAVGPAFLYEAVRRDEFVDYLESVAEGSAYPAVRPERIAQAVVPLPQLSELQEFEDHAMGLRRRIQAAEVESRSLARMRDELLPGLISGAIRVRDAEQAVEAAT